ncbi:hypothetical protein J2754_002025 [Halarchaeum solikamskense]|uniref:DUF5789 family protein n=1 Tax=Halarchaeum nitratireducens TaxID=489913 RepID=UPI001B3A8E39|nr:hypothetical protein [Halarchaeum solikamskense]MBP2251693.1 hypothetical protein [Halarchaeum solikamskense]
MADDKRGREKQARDAERRRQERDIATELDRGEESEPPVEAAALDDVEAALESVRFPASGADVVAAIGDRTIESDGERYAIEALVPETDREAFDSPAAVRVTVRRPTVASAMKRIVESIETRQDAEFSWSQRKAYETTFRALGSIDADDDDEGIAVIRDWVVDRVRETGDLPSSRAVRREAAEFCRTNGYQIRADEWLGI